MITKKCIACGKEFKVKPYRALSARFCSSKCWTTSSESKKIVSKTQIVRHKKNPTIGKNNPNYRGGSTPEYKMRLLRKSWQLLRERMFKLYGYVCQNCGKANTISKLCIHHKRPWRNGGLDEISNLQIICNICHPKVERESIYQEAIIKKCTSCMGDQGKCDQESCPLYFFSPFRIKVLATSKGKATD